MLDNIRETRLALKAPLGTPIGGGFRSANVRLREEFKLYANVRPAVSYLHDRRRYDKTDIVLIRENTEGLYVGVEHYIPIDDDPRAVAEASGIITRAGCRRIAEYTFDYAIKNNRKKVTIVHKANILKKLTGLFLETAQEVGKKYEGQLEIEDRIVDNTAMQLVTNPSQFDMILTTNMFGDILSDEIAGLIGGLGLAPGGNIGKDAAIFEAVHGTAPDIAGKGIANPTALLLASAMMLDHINEKGLGDQLRFAIQKALEKPETRTGDLQGSASTKEYTKAVISFL
jgi:isocitrate dehydrogenase (NAD+)